MLKRVIVLSSVLLLLMAGASSVAAQKWIDLGTREVKDKSEQDTWHLGPDKGTFRAVRILVQKHPVKFYRLRVTYANGQQQEFQLANRIKAGGQTRVLDLSGAERVIDKVDVWYEAYTAGDGVRSQVTLMGRR